jgi:hypothetical protein
MPGRILRFLFLAFFPTVYRVLEPGPLGDEAEIVAGGAARLVHSRFPLADGLLARAELVRQRLLAEPHVLPQRLDRLGVPFIHWSTLSAQATYLPIVAPQAS